MNFTEMLNERTRDWKFESASLDENPSCRKLAYAFFIGTQCKAICTLHLDAVAQTLADFLDGDERFTVRLMPTDEAKRAFLESLE